MSRDGIYHVPTCEQVDAADLEHRVQFDRKRRGCGRIAKEVCAARKQLITTLDDYDQDDNRSKLSTCNTLLCLC